MGILYRVIKRSELQALNQKHVYKQYNESITKDFFEFRSHNRPLSPRSKHDNIASFGGGHCGELADFLAYELRKNLNKPKYSHKGYEVKRMSAACDHAYIYLSINLRAHEAMYYRLDLWDMDCQELTKEQYHLDNDQKWGKQTVKARWNQNSPLTINSQHPRIYNANLVKNETPESPLSYPDYLYDHDTDTKDKLLQDLRDLFFDAEKQEKAATSNKRKTPDEDTTNLGRTNNQRQRITPQSNTTTTTQSTPSRPFEALQQTTRQTQDCSERAFTH